MVGAGVRVVATYPVRGESRRSAHSDGQRAIQLDSVPVCRTADPEGEARWAAVSERVERDAHARLRRFDDDGPVTAREAFGRVAAVTERLNAD